MTPVLELRNITKQFPGVLACDHINLTLEEGEIHALLGENGAGKSTLMNILYGLYHPDEGEIIVRGQPTQIDGPTDAIRQGIGMVHQHFMLIPVLSVTENVMLGDEPTKGLRPKSQGRSRPHPRAFAEAWPARRSRGQNRKHLGWGAPACRNHQSALPACHHPDPG